MPPRASGSPVGGKGASQSERAWGLCRQIRALAYWPNYRDASRSQYWMLAVMIAFTGFGLYLLSEGNG